MSSLEDTLLIGAVTLLLCYSLWHAHYLFIRLPGLGKVPNVFQALSRVNFLARTGWGEVYFGLATPYGKNFPLDFQWSNWYKPNGSDVMSISSLADDEWVVADPNLAKIITQTQAQYFPKPTHLYVILKYFGPSILVTEGQEWKRHRRATASAFSESLMRLVWTETQRLTMECFSHVESHPKDTKVPIVELNEVIPKLTLLIFLATGFGAKTSWTTSETPPEHHKYTLHQCVRSIISKETIMSILIPPWLARSGIVPVWRERYQLVMEYRQYLQELVVERRDWLEQQETRDKRSHDLLTSLVVANMDTGELTEEELHGNISIYLLAGHETTANTLMFALARLALHPDVQEKVYQECCEVRGVAGEEFRYEDFSKLVYTQAVLNECLRLHPAVPLVPKWSSESVDTPYGHIRSKLRCVLHILAMHKNGTYWPQPDLFRPERFLEPYNKDAFMPFSEGSRGCIGKRFALIEATLVLACFVSQYQLRPAEPDVDLLEAYFLITTHPKNPIKLALHPRT
jgi:cytochrome P450